MMIFAFCQVILLRLYSLYQLEWLRIQSLIGQKTYNEVRESLEQYRLQEGDYRDKADSLWMLLLSLIHI